MTTKELKVRSRRFSPVLESLAALMVVSQLAMMGFSLKFDADAKVEAQEAQLEQAKFTTSAYLAPPATVLTTTTLPR